MTAELAEALRLIDQYRLLNRCPKLERRVWLAKNGRTSAAQDRLLLYRVRQIAEYIKDHPCYLHRPPTEEQLTADGRPDIEFFTPDTHFFIPSVSIYDMPFLLEAMDKLFLEHEMGLFRRGRAKAEALPDLCRKFLEAIANRSVVRSAVAWRCCARSSQAAKEKAIARLSLRKLIATDQMRLSKRNSQLVEATEEGRKLVGGVAPKKKGRGSMKHRFISESIVATERQLGHEAELEALVTPSGYSCDVGVRDGNQWHVYEVVVDCETNLTAHLKACFLDSKVVATVTVVATQKSTLERLEDLVSAELSLAPFHSRLRFECAERFLVEETVE